MVVRGILAWLQCRARSRAVGAGAALLAITAGVSALVAVAADPTPARGDASASAAGPPWEAYVANLGSNTVSVIDTATNRVVDTIPVCSFPLNIAITPDATKAYVVCIGSGDVDVISTATNTVISTIALGSDTSPQRIAITPDGSKAYTANLGTADVSVIDTATNTVLATIPTGVQPRWVTITPDGRTAYVTDSGNATQNVPVIDTASDTVESRITVGPGVGLGTSGITPDGQTLYFGNFTSHQVFAVSTATSQVIATIPTNTATGDPAALRVAPSGQIVYVTTSAEVEVLNTASNTVTAAIPPAEGGVTGFTPDNRLAYVPFIDPVAVIDTASGTTIATVGVGSSPAAAAITPDQAPVARLTVVSAPAGSPTLLDASASTVKFGTIASFAWNFGDGTTAVTSGPVTHHVYARPGFYHVTVTETSSGGTSTTQVFTGQMMSRNGGPSAIAAATADIMSPAPTPSPTRPFVPVTG